jgi:hypothetical protein
MKASPDGERGSAAESARVSLALKDSRFGFIARFGYKNPANDAMEERDIAEPRTGSERMLSN